jgi:hypothetical protein
LHELDFKDTIDYSVERRFARNVCGVEEREPFMPIRFRCVYCSKLLGIGRRKAGSVVNCPACQKQLLVPNSEPVGVTENSISVGANGDPHQESANDEARQDTPPPPMSKKPMSGPQLFERSDFEILLEAKPTDKPPEKVKKKRNKDAPPPLPSPLERPLENPLDFSQQIPRKEPVGIFISANRATWLSILAIVAITLAFGAGLIIGRFLKPG